MFSVISTSEKNVNETNENERVYYIPDYDIIKISDDTKVILVGNNHRYNISDVWFTISRYSISEGIFESKLASMSYSEMKDGNTYKLISNNRNIIYIHIDAENMYIGKNININENYYIEK